METSGSLGDHTNLIGLLVKFIAILNKSYFKFSQINVFSSTCFQNFLKTLLNISHNFLFFQCLNKTFLKCHQSFLQFFSKWLQNGKSDSW